MEDQHVILVLPELGREFCFCLNHNIITQAMNQNIKGAKNDLEALQYIREVSEQALIFRELSHCSNGV